MYPEAIQLETLRQKIEDARYESAMRSEMLDRGKPSAAETKKTREYVNQFDSQAKALTEELQQTIAATRLQNLPPSRNGLTITSACCKKLLMKNQPRKMRQSAGTWQKERSRNGKKYAPVNSNM